MYSRFFKRFFDVVFSVIAILVFAIPMLLIAVVIKIDSKGPAIFMQTRVGKYKSHFRILKFRTMYIDAPAEAPTHQLKNAEAHITRVGKFLRKTSLDELPQLFNILCGDMSFVGPRPVLWNEYELFDERDKYGANDIVPGLTGWAQINGRDELAVPLKAKYDGEYVERMSFLFDLRCLLGTVSFVLGGHGVVEGGTGTLNGSDKESH